MIYCFAFDYRYNEFDYVKNWRTNCLVGHAKDCFSYV